MSKILFETPVYSQDYQSNINQIVSNVGYNLEKYEMYDDLTNQEILDFHPDEKIYQFDRYTLSIHSNFELKKEDNVYCIYLDNLLVGKISPIANVQIDNFVSQENINFQLDNYGGRYKKVVIKDDGSDSIKSYREPYSFKLLAVEQDLVEYSDYAKSLINNGQTFYCNNCGYSLNGERICPNCQTRIFYPGELDNNNLSKVGNSIQSVGGSVQNVGNSMSKTGWRLILGCTIPILLLIVLGALIF